MNNTGKNIYEEAAKANYIKSNREKLQIAKLLTVAMIIVALLMSFFVFESPAPLRQWVYDNDNILNDATINVINYKNSELQAITGSEVVVVVEEASGKNKDVDKRAGQLFKNYKVDDKGILILMVVPAVRDNNKSNVSALEEWGASIGESIGEFFGSIFGVEESYYGYRSGRNVDFSLETMLQDNGVFSGEFTENYNAGNYNAALLNAFNAVIAYFENYYDLGLESSYVLSEIDPPQVVSSAGYSLFTIIIAILILMLVLIFSGRKKARRLNNINNSRSFFG